MRDAGRDEAPRSFRVLFVCTGNLCRSPMAAALFAARVGWYPGVEVHSAGTHAHPGLPIFDDAARVLRELGHPFDEHRTRRVTPALADSAHLILTATMEHRRQVLIENPDALRRTFTLREFARLGADLGPPGPDPRKRVLEVAAQRGHVPETPGRSDDIADPFGHPLDAMRACAGHIDEAVRDAVTILGLTRRPLPPQRRR